MVYFLVSPIFFGKTSSFWDLILHATEAFSRGQLALLDVPWEDDESARVVSKMQLDVFATWYT